MAGDFAWQKTEEILGECTCSIAYVRIRELGINPVRTDPNCIWCNYSPEVMSALRDVRYACAQIAIDFTIADSVTLADLCNQIGQEILMSNHPKTPD